MGLTAKPTSTIHRATLHRCIGAVAALFVFACGDGTAPSTSAPPPIDDGRPLSVAVRTHLLEHPENSSLNTFLSTTEVQVVFDGANAVWVQASINLTIESVVREQARDSEEFDRALRGEVGFTTGAVASVLPRTHVLPDGWNVFFVHDLGGFVLGIYVAEVPAVVCAELDRTGQRDLGGSVAHTLAHELGHSFGLFHAPCTPEGNLMAPGCSEGDRTRLTESQIEVARAQVRYGRPYGVR
ncbi:MAG: hypothetical protein GTN78_04360 [Gemmatimonadales bacterium]|nr:hypothetical protein [Gemmatimonadales bacterium]NIQ99419.1 hypothetical protein [Gemmatimonadales bacterium]NIS64087.1 hypothetical protein [Gemmatimonadales bacterium]